ncbi:hypothetical protein [Papillibacter cinnamivorans]|uniref:hypothetical protein n=1 Tax=Papillibacter cinnamivorans TaxID=100176 RepID=UPI000A00ADC7|nr:hypothetical protein [Papillibacter cinnamivorans]
MAEQDLASTKAPHTTAQIDPETRQITPNRAQTHTRTKTAQETHLCTADDHQKQSKEAHTWEHQKAMEHTNTPSTHRTETQTASTATTTHKTRPSPSSKPMKPRQNPIKHAPTKPIPASKITKPQEARAQRTNHQDTQTASPTDLNRNDFHKI